MSARGRTWCTRPWHRAHSVTSRSSAGRASPPSLIGSRWCTCNRPRAPHLRQRYSSLAMAANRSRRHRRPYGFSMPEALTQAHGFRQLRRIALEGLASDPTVLAHQYPQIALESILRPPRRIYARSRVKYARVSPGCGQACSRQGWRRPRRRRGHGDAYRPPPPGQAVETVPPPLAAPPQQR